MRIATPCHIIKTRFDWKNDLKLDFTIIKTGDVHIVKSLEEHEFEEAGTDALEDITKSNHRFEWKKMSCNLEKRNEWPGEIFLKFHN